MWRPFLLLGWVNPISHYSIQPEIYLYRTVKSVERNRRKDKAVKTAIIFFFAVLSEVTATTALKFSEGFTKLIPSVVVVLGYGLSFYLLSLTLKVMPIGIAYAFWSGIGIILTVIAGIVLWHETLDWARGIGIFLIMVGILIINLFSKSAVH